MKKINSYLLQRPKLLLTLMWVFFALAAGPGIILNLVAPEMGFFKFLGIIIVPALLALYLRLLYTKVQDKKREERRAQKAAENQARYQHKKKK